MKDMNFHFAPIQGHTDAPYRHFHRIVYGDHTCYYTPFIRLENDSLRQRDIKDLVSPMNDGCRFIPQIIFRDCKELTALTALIRGKGFRAIDLNMGCPFPLQTGHGRGAATVADKELCEAVARTVEENPDITFSVKIRLGLTDPTEWNTLLCELNKVRLSHITVHPRVARQQYGGDIDFDQFRRILEESHNPVIYNGDIKTPDDIEETIKRLPGISGIMCGRGLLGRPSLIAEYLSGKEWNHEERIDKMLDFHRKLLDHYSANLCGDSQIISKIKPFWEYTETEIGRKAWKAVKKATNIAKYHSAVAMIGQLHQ